MFRRNGEKWLTYLVDFRSQTAQMSSPVPRQASLKQACMCLYPRAVQDEENTIVYGQIVLLPRAQRQMSVQILSAEKYRRVEYT